MAETHGRTFDAFVGGVRDLLDPTASRKGYTQLGPDGPNQLFEFVASFAGPHHALGEVVYKAKRYDARKDPVDLLKLAAWAFLLWKHHADPPTPA